MVKEGLNSSTFADKIGFSKGAITHVLNERNRPSLKMLQEILRAFPTINPDWLQSGNGVMYRSNYIPPKDLFGKEDVNANTQTEIPIEPQKTAVKTPQNPSNLPENKEIKEEKINSKKISKILILYDDNTFMSFIPEN
jgi:transcriptional regulator with XRE-family HTH domain